MQILDMDCAKAGFEIAKECNKKKDEPLIRNALGILKEDGLYAFLIFLKEKEKKENDKISRQLFSFLESQPILGITGGYDNDNFLKEIRDKLSGNLDLLLYAKELLERVMVYALYHLRAK